jgi:hypothetical protein
LLDLSREQSKLETSQEIDLFPEIWTQLDHLVDAPRHGLVRAASRRSAQPWPIRADEWQKAVSVWQVGGSVPKPQWSVKPDDVTRPKMPPPPARIAPHGDSATVTVRVTAGVERVLEPEASASTSSSHPASQTLRLDPRQRPQNADELSGRLLACSAARAWSPVQARAWWEAHRELVQHRVRERTASVQGSFDARPREKPGRLARRDITARERW